MTPASLGRVAGDSNGSTAPPLRGGQNLLSRLRNAAAFAILYLKLRRGGPMEELTLEHLRAILEMRSLRQKSRMQVLSHTEQRSLNRFAKVITGLDRAPSAAGTNLDGIHAAVSDDRFAEIPSEAILHEMRARQKSIYGEDDRVEVIACPDPERKIRARSVAAVIDRRELVAVGDRQISIGGTTLGDRYASLGKPLCQREAFRLQPCSAIGTAFLVAPALVASAHHCLSEATISYRCLVFDFETDSTGAASTIFHADQVYGIRRFLKGAYTETGEDWALVELDRGIFDREPLTLRSSGSAPDSLPLYVIGHPAGLPKKIAGNAEIRVNTASSNFIANLDTYGGNSGSPVFNALSHEVEGILARGDADFVPLGDCYASLICPITGCQGEECSRVEPLNRFLKEAELLSDDGDIAMDTFVNLPPTAEAWGTFDLRIAAGTLVLKKINGVAVFCFRRADGSSFSLDVGVPIEIASIYSDRIVVLTATGETGLFQIGFELSVGGVSKVLTVGVLVGEVLLDCDADRDGVVEHNGEGKANWTWGDDGRGAIVLVDNDADLETSATLDERETIIVRSLNVEKLPAGLILRLSTSAEGALNFSVLRKTAQGYQKVLGRLPSEPPQALVTHSDDLNPAGENLFVAAHAFPSPFFDGLLLINLELIFSLGKAERVVAADRVLMRVAPWIMTPNTQPAQKIYTCRIEKSDTNNDHFLAGLKAAVEEEGLELETLEAVDHRDDRWIQDEIEIGYAQSHRGYLPVVFDSPRDRGLDNYPEARMLGPDFGHFVVGGGVPNSLDSFGNLEVSPPVTVGGRNYPLGRVIIGGRQHGDLSHSARQMMVEVRQFLYAQRVQFPFEVYTDWLAVGHVDEIVTFVPDEAAPKGFRCLLASPAEVKSILLNLQQSGHGAALLFEGQHRLDRSGQIGEPAELTVDTLLADTDFWDGNDVYQQILAEVRQVLERELGVDSADFVQIPVAFQVRRAQDGSLQRTLAYFPDMVNHLVHDDVSIVPKPYGPVIGGRCAFEKAFEDALPGRRVKFIDDWYSYHEMSGEVHCGTNALRQPFVASRWWSVRPEGGFDIKALQI